MKPIKAAKNILDIAKESRNKFAVTGREFDKVQANMYSVFECYAHGVISWDTTKKYFQESIKKYLSLHKDNMLKEERASMKQEYKRVVVEYKIALDEYKKVNEQKLSNKLLKHVGFIGESAAQAQSKKYYNERALTESELKDTASLSWERVMEAYPNLTTKDEDRVRMLTIFEGPTVDTTQMITTVMKEDDINFNPRAGHMDQPSHPQNKGLTKRSTSPRPKLRPKNFDQIVQRAAINKAVQSAMGEGYKELPPINRDRYQERPGLEGPFSTLSGKVVYYDPKEGAYYDPDTDMYLSYDEFKELDNDRRGMEENDLRLPAGTSRLKPGFRRGGLASGPVSQSTYDQEMAAAQRARTAPKPKAPNLINGPRVAESARGLGSIDWPDVDEDGDSAMAQHAENAIRHNMHAYDAFGHVFSMTADHREWMNDNKDMIIDMFASYGLATESQTNEEMSDDEIDAFHRALDALVHKHLGHSSDEVEERKMTKSEKAKEERLKDKYDDSDMKASMKKQYGDDWENVYYATIRKQAMEDNEDFDIDLNDPDQAVEAAFHEFKAGLKKGVNQHEMRMRAHEELAFDIGMSSVMKKLPDGGKSLHQQLDKLIIDAINKMDPTGEIPEGQKRRPDHNMQAQMRLQKIMQQAIKDSKKKRGIEDDDEKEVKESAGLEFMDDLDWDFSNISRLDWEAYEQDELEEIEDWLYNMDLDDQMNDRYDGMYARASKYVEKKRKEMFNEMTSAGGIASVAQPMGKMQRRKKTTEAHPNSKEYDKCWDGYEKVPGKKRGEPGSCRKKD